MFIAGQPHAKFLINELDSSRPWVFLFKLLIRFYTIFSSYVER